MPRIYWRSFCFGFNWPTDDQLSCDNMYCIALSVGVAIVCMQFLPELHAPAGANRILVIMTGIRDFEFLITPVLLG